MARIFASADWLSRSLVDKAGCSARRGLCLGMLARRKEPERSLGLWSALVPVPAAIIETLMTEARLILGSDEGVLNFSPL